MKHKAAYSSLRPHTRVAEGHIRYAILKLKQPKAVSELMYVFHGGRCFVYRLVSWGTMEEKIYKRQINKQSRAARAVDSWQVHQGPLRFPLPAYMNTSIPHTQLPQARIHNYLKPAYTSSFRPDALVA
jgi:hypothetical protein